MPGQKSLQKFRWFFWVNLVNPKGYFEINWPLAVQGKNKRNKKLHNVSLKHNSRLKFLPSKSRKALMIVRMIISFVFIFCRHIQSMKQAAKISEETFALL